MGLFFSKYFKKKARQNTVKPELRTIRGKIAWQSNENTKKKSKPCL